MTKTPLESWPAAAARVQLAYSATMVDADRLYVTESWSLWRAIATRQLTSLLDTLVAVLLPNPVDKIGISAILHERTLDIKNVLGSMRVETHNPRGAHMDARGKVAERLFRSFVDVLSARVTDYQTMQTAPSKTPRVGVDKLFTLNELCRTWGSAAGAMPAVRGPPTPASHPGGSGHTTLFPPPAKPSPP